MAGVADMSDLADLARRKVGKRAKNMSDGIGSVADFIEILNSTVGKHFKCCICLSILEDPVMLPCNHPLCRGCATQCLRQNQRCPQCLTPIPNLRMLQGRNKWINEMVISLKNCLNGVGVSLTQHAPVPSKYRDNPPPKPPAGRSSAASRRARARARAGAGAGAGSSVEDDSRYRPASVSCGGGDRGEPRRNGRSGVGGMSGNGAMSSSASARPAPPLSASNGENEAGTPLPPPSSPPPPPPQSPSPPPPPQQPFVVGDLVFVDHRSWPGMNKDGGVALVTAVLDPPGSRYDVKYSVSRKFDRGVEARFVHTYAFPEETVGGRSRRGGGGSVRSDSRSRRHARGSVRSGNTSLSPRGRHPVVTPAAGSRASVRDVATDSATVALASPEPRRSPPRCAGEHIEATDGRSSDSDPVGPVAAAGSSCPAPVSAVAGGSSAVGASLAAVAGSVRGQEEHRRGGDAVGHHDEGDGADDAVEKTPRESEPVLADDGKDDENILSGRGFSLHNGDGDHEAPGGLTSVPGNEDVLDNDSATTRGRDQDGADDGDIHDDRTSDAEESGAAAPLSGEELWRECNDVLPAADSSDREKEGREEDSEASPAALLLSGAIEKDVDENETEKKMDENEERHHPHGYRISPERPLASRGTCFAGIVAPPACPLSPTSRSNRSGSRMGVAAAFDMERSDTRRHRECDSPSSGARDSNLTGAAEGLMALFSTTSAPPAPARIDREMEGEVSMGGSGGDGDKAETKVPPQPPEESRAVGESSSSSSGGGGGDNGIHPGEPGAAARTKGQPLTLLATAAALETPASAPESPFRQTSPPEPQSEDTAKTSGEKDGGGPNPSSDSTGTASSTEMVVNSRADARAISPRSLTKSASPPAPPPPSRPSGQASVASNQGARRTVMPPPPPSFPSPASRSPMNATPSSSSTPPQALPSLQSPAAPGFKVGDLVMVPSRSSPGVNKEGGVAKVTMTHADGTLDVKFIVRQGREKGVPASILSSYAVDDEHSGGGDGGMDGDGDGGERNIDGYGSTGDATAAAAAAAAAAAGASGSSSSSSVEVGRGRARNPAVRRTSRANKGWCSPDLAAGQANAACLSYLLGETQNQELDLDPDLGELLDPSEYSSGGNADCSTSAPSDEVGGDRETASGARKAKAPQGEREENDDATVAASRKVQGAGVSGVGRGRGKQRRGNRGRLRGNGKRKRTAHDSDHCNESSVRGEDGVANEREVSGDNRARLLQEQGRRRRRSNTETGAGNTNTGEDRNCGSGSVSSVPDLSVVSNGSESAGEKVSVAAADSDTDNPVDVSSGRNVFDIAAVSAGSESSGDGDAAISSIPPTGSYGRNSSSCVSARSRAGSTAAAADSDDDHDGNGGAGARGASGAASATGRKRSRASGNSKVVRAGQPAGWGSEFSGSKKSKASVPKARASSSLCDGSGGGDGGGGGGGGGREHGMSVNSRRGRAAAVEAETGAAVVLTMSGSTTEMSTVADSLAKSLGWVVEPRYTEKVTHVVCGTVPKNAKVKVRSAKFLRAVASGKWVLAEGWLQACKRRRARVDETPFEVSGDKKSVVPSAPTRSRLAHADSDRPGLFEGITFHFRGEFGTVGSPPLSELEPMLLANGGKVVGKIESLFARPTTGLGGGGGEGRGGKGGSGGGGGGSSSAGQGGDGGGSGGWRPPRVVIFQPSSASTSKDVRMLERDLAALADPPSMRVEVVKPIWLVDSIGCFRVLKPTVQHRLPSFRGES